MAYTPYDWTQNLQNRREYMQDQLREGSPVVGMSFGGGVVLLTLRRTQNKIFEIYDHLMFSGLGRQADLETLRLAAIDFSHKEGFTLSTEDVTSQRVVGVALSPLLKRGFGDFFTHPLVARAMFAELGPTPQEDIFYTLDFDGEFVFYRAFAIAAGTKNAEDEALNWFQQNQPEGAVNLADALKLALNAWVQGRFHSLQKEEIIGTQPTSFDPGEILRNELQHGTIEAAVLERGTTRESKFRHVREEEIAPVIHSLLEGQ